jgi:integrase/recombinase XerD
MAMGVTHRQYANSKRAKIIPLPDQATFVEYVLTKRHGWRNAVMALLSFKAGLRACEIAGLDWTMVLDANGRVSDSIAVSSSIAKKGSGRTIPCHAELGRALRKLHEKQGKPLSGPICRSERGGSLSAKAVVNWFAEQYRALGFQGCSSHSGRRTLITLAARSLAKVGGSLKDVQELAGHRSLTTTEAYIQGDRAIQRRLIGML